VTELIARASHAATANQARTPWRASTIVGRAIRVLVVDDSVVMRRLLTRMRATDPLIEVVGCARDGRDAHAKVGLLRPDLVTLDVEMPEMDGLEALRLIQVDYPAVRVIMCSSLTQRGASVTIDALLAGASDYVCKQHSGGLTEDAYALLQAELLSKIRYVFNLGGPVQAGQSSGAEKPARLDQARSVSPGPPSLPGGTRQAIAGGSVPAARQAPEVLVIGVSTGGPAALAEILPMLPPDFPLPIAVVQHMPPFFTQLLAERLSRLSPLPVVEAVDKMPFKPGTVVLARGDTHMRLIRRLHGVQIELNQQEPENSCRPAVDVLFRSAAEVYAGAAIAVVLTGMGQDGLEGVRALKVRGASALVQDSATSVVWGMPGAVASADLADAILPLQEIIPEVLRRL
jgi:two-component system chemotaxis response regulator CheB